MPQVSRVLKRKKKKHLRKKKDFPAARVTFFILTRSTGNKRGLIQGSLRPWRIRPCCILSHPHKPVDHNALTSIVSVNLPFFTLQELYTIEILTKTLIDNSQSSCVISDGKSRIRSSKCPNYENGWGS